MVYGVLRLINFANSEVVMVGTFATVIAQVTILNNPADSDPLSGFNLVTTLLFSALFSAVVCGILGILVEIVAYRRLRARGTNRLASLISAIAVSIFLSELVRILTRSAPVTSPRLLDKWSFGEVAGANFRIDTVLIIIAGAIIFIALDRFVSKSRFGMAIRAVSMSEENSKLMGINLDKVVSLTFFIGGLTTGIAGFFYTTVYETTQFNVGFNLGLAAFTAAVLGGIGNLRGAFYGGIFLGILEQFSSAILGSQWKAVTVFVVLVLVLLIKPSGIFGEAVQQTRT